MNGRGDGLDRRVFFAGGGAGLLLLNAPLGRAEAADEALVQTFLRIDPDDTVTVFAKHLDMGQGIWSGLASIVAEELDADWRQVRVEGAPAAPAYKHLKFGVQTTGNSTSISNSYEQLRKAGATARAMLVSAAARRWSCPPAEVAVCAGVVSWRRRRLSFGRLAEAAAKEPPPADPPLKRPDAFRYLGKRWPRLDVADKTLGRTVYGLDVRLPGMLTAVLAHPPRFGATLSAFDPAEALKVEGVRQVVRTPHGVAVIAQDTWSAWKGRRVLKLQWDEASGETRSSADLAALFDAALDQPGLVAAHEGDVDAAMAGATEMMHADFRFPYLAHAAMEPLAAVCQITAEGCELWGGFQSQTGNQKVAAKILDLPIEKVKLNTLYAGGSFGRRASFDSDWVAALVEVAKASGGSSPVKLMWTREDDTRGGYYRPMTHLRLRAGLDRQGDVVAAEEVVASQSLLFGGPFGDPALTKPDPTAFSGGFTQRYDAPARRLRWVSLKTGVPVHTLRAVSFNVTTFAKEVFMDELARAAHVDPLAYRLRHLKTSPRQAAVLSLAAEMAGWGRPLPTGCAQGLAVQEADETFVAQVAQICVREGRLKVERVVCAVDCGFALNPDNVRAQMEGGIGYALGYTLRGEITLRKGAVVQSNFHDYPPLRLEDMPDVEVHVVASDQPPTGVGEPGSTPTPAAVANAVARLTGRPVRALPLSEALWSDVRGAQA